MEKLQRKQTLVVKTGSSPLFEEAHFILREKGGSFEESEMMREANRILASYEMHAHPAKKNKRPPSALFYFISGMVCGLLFTAAVAAILTFLP